MNSSGMIISLCSLIVCTLHCQAGKLILCDGLAVTVVLYL